MEIFCASEIWFWGDFSVFFLNISILSLNSFISVVVRIFFLRIFFLFFLNSFFWSFYLEGFFVEVLVRQ